MTRQPIAKEFVVSACSSVAYAVRPQLHARTVALL